jgi:hypothetical protein
MNNVKMQASSAQDQRTGKHNQLCIEGAQHAFTWFPGSVSIRSITTMRPSRQGRVHHMRPTTLV